ncbi:MAG: type II secretion system major pseudopilin GspG [Candidatus Omnitrophica bacterium]|nr:type II secretion system major pseudopilin GspG [Candidatus Omnitrophota bacterium]
MRNKGFTLIEIMLVVAIIGILAAMVVPRLTGRTKQAREAVAKADIEVNMPMALDLYELDIGEFPSGLGSLMDNTDNKDDWKGPYLKRVPKDPWGREYIYNNPGSHNKYGFDLSSSGADGQSGTNDDITNWEE